MTRVLIVVTSHSWLGDDPESTGVGLQTVAAAWYSLIEADVDVVIASPRGGRPPIDPLTFGEEVETAPLTRFLTDDEAVQLFNSSLPLDDVAAGDFDAVFFAGGHGGMWDFPGNPQVQNLIRSIVEAGGYVAAVCHGVAALCDDHDHSILAGRRVTGLTTQKESLLERDEVVPFLIQDRILHSGGIFVEADPFAPHVVEDGQLITGQNMRSTDLVVRALLDRLSLRQAATTADVFTQP